MANPNANAAVDLSDNDLEFTDFPQRPASTPTSTGIEFVSIAQKQAPVERQLAIDYADAKGLPVKIRREEGVFEGRLIEWENDSVFRVIWRQNGSIITSTYHSSDLYGTEGNEKLEGAVEFLRENKEEAEREGSQIRSMLSSVLESKAA